jgi:propanol-preferring alcohol dehydrogenase
MSHIIGHAKPVFDGMMTAMCMHRPNEPLRLSRVPIPEIKDGQLLIRVRACGVCRTDLHILDAELPIHKTPLIPGHEVVGEVVNVGTQSHLFSYGDRVGIAWLGKTCGHCAYCLSKHENLCDKPQFTGYDNDGGYAEYVAADATYCFQIPGQYDDIHAAPLLCAGLIGYRAYTMIIGAQRIGLYGFGAAAHIIAQIAIQQGKEVYAFTRPGDTPSQDFARSLGATWAGDSNQLPPAKLDAAIIFAASGELVPLALAATRKGASVVCAGIYMSDIPGFSYSLLWGERSVRSVANLTRADGAAFFASVKQYPVQINVVRYALTDANQALNDLRAGAFDGVAVLVPDSGDDID